MAPSTKLIYFNARFRAELSRWILHYTGQEFEDQRVEFPQWPALKPTMPFGQLPVLEVDGKKLAQASAIGRFLARRHGLAGENDWDCAQADALVDYVADGFAAMGAHRKAHMARDQPAIEAAKSEFVGTGVVPFLKKLEQHLQTNNGGQGFFVGTKPTWADFAVVVFEDEVVRMSATVLDGYPLLKSHNQRVHELKGIKEWTAKRPETAI